MSRLASRLLSLLAVVVLMPYAPLAQTKAQNDKAAADAVKNKGLPLITDRTLSFTTSEGTWLSLDLSPDGKTIVFELLGDLYTLPIIGGEATRITSGQAYDMQPAFSPDGKKLVFISDRNGSENVWVANADGTRPRAITTTERQSYMSPTWSPDGEYVIAARGAQLWMYHESGGSGVQMTGVSTPAPAGGGPGGGGGAAPSILGPAFGGGRLWVNVRGNVRPGLATRLIADESDPQYDPHTPLRSSARVIGPYQIAQLDQEDGRLLVRTHEHEGAFRPIPSPDGKWLVYSTRYDSRQALKVIDLSTGEDRWLKMDVQRDESQGGGARDRDVYPKSAFTPDSKSLITSYDGKIWRVSVPDGNAVEIPFTAKVEQQLGPLVKFDYRIEDEKLRVSQIRGARPSPDGKRIVFTALDRLWIADLPQGRGTKKEEPAGAAGDAEKNDGAAADKSAADTSQKPSSEAQAKPTAETPPPPAPTIRKARRLTTGTDVEHGPVWSPDGQYVAYVTWNDDDGGRIYRVRADGSSEPERLTPVAAFYDKLAYSRDGSRLIGVRGSKMHRLRTLEDFGDHRGAAELEYVWLPATGGAVSRIAWAAGGSTEQGREAPHIGPDPDRVYVWAGSDGLLSMRYDGTDVKTIVKVTAPAPPPQPGGPPGPPPTPDEVLLSPDGKRALVRASRNVYMITVPPVAGVAPTISAAGSSSMPTWRLTKVGGDFIGWTADSQAAHFSIGRSFFLHDIATQAEVDLANRIKAETEAERTSAPASTEKPSGDTPETKAGQKPPAPPKIPTLEYEPHRVDVEIVVDKDKPKGIIALRNARLITMKGDEVIPRGDIVITDNRITAIGPSGKVQIPAGAVVRDLSGKTIMPGLVDIHAHTWVAWGVHRSQVSQFLAQLAFGVTTQRDPQTSSEDALTYQDLMDIGQLIGPRLYSTGPGVFAADNIRSLDDARDVLRRYSDHYNTKTIKQYMVGDRKVRQWVIMAAKELGLTPTTEGGSNFTMNLTLMQDGYAGLEHSLPISPFFDDVVKLGAVSGITYTPTLIVSYGGPIGRQYYLTNGSNVDEETRLRRFTPHDELDKWKNTDWSRADQYVFPLHAKQLTKWANGGGKLGLGSHGEVQGIGAHWELWMMASGGMKPHAVLKAATIDSADAIGFAKDIGSLEVGKLADLIVLDANPLEDIKNTVRIAEVMKNGRLYDAGLNDTYPRQKPLDPQWWWKLEPPAPPAVKRSRSF